MILQNFFESPQLCPECGGPAFTDLLLAEKQDACYHKVRSRYKVWPSAYASGALVQCRKKGAANWGNKNESADDNFGKPAAMMKASPEALKTAQSIVQKQADRNVIGQAKIAGAIPSQGVAEESQTPEKELERLKLRQNAEHGGASLKRQAATQARIRELEKQVKDQQGVAEGGEGSGRRTADAWDTSPGRMGRVEKTAQGIRHHADSSRYGGSEPEPEFDRLDKSQVSAMDKALGVKWDRESKRYYSPIKVDEQGVAEGSEPNREAGKAIQNLKNLALMKSALTSQQLAQAGRESIITDAIKACIQFEQSYLQNKQQGNAIFVRALRDEIDNFRKGYPINTSMPEDTTSELGDLLQGKLGKVNFQQGVAEGSNDTSYPNAEVI
jgi:hypothetical protein